MNGFTPEEGIQVRIDIPDETDPDHSEFHGCHGTIKVELRDQAGQETGNTRDSTIYRIKFDDGSTADFQWRDLRPPIDF